MRLIRAGDRVFACGKTGSGKTYLMQRLTASLPRLVVLDGKGTLGAWGLDAWDREHRLILRNGEAARLRIVWDVGSDPFEFWNEVMLDLYNIGNLTVYIDELYSLSDVPGKVQPALRALYTRGRELGIGVWASTQRPVSVPLVTMSEAEHFFMFRLTMDDDRQRMAEFMTQAVREAIKDKHGFYYMFAEDDGPSYIPQLQEGMITRAVGETESIPERG